MKNTIIFKDTECINYLRETLTEVCNIMNANHKKVLEFNPNLSPNITFYQSFYNPTLDNEFIVNKAYTELRDIIKAKSPFYTESMVEDYYKKLKDYLHYNQYKKSLAGYYYIDDSNFNEEQHTKELAKKNIEIIPRGVANYNLGSFDRMELAEEYIIFSDDKFIIDEIKFKQFEDSRTYLADNSRQSKAMEILNNISKEFEELQELNPNIGKNLFTDVKCSLISDKNLVRVIKDIK